MKVIFSERDFQLCLCRSFICLSVLADKNSRQELLVWQTLQPLEICGPSTKFSRQ